MDTRTLTALQGSIEKWERIAAGKGGDYGLMNCPLCIEFWEEGCQGCPVSAASGKPKCDGTPYDDWDEAGCFSVETEEHRVLAQAELDFLRSLLPAEHRHAP